MRNERGSIDWQATEDAARALSYRELEGSIKCTLSALPSADARDRDHMDRCPTHCVTCYHQSDGGYYRDCLSVFRAELARRDGKHICRECGAERCKR